MSVSLSVIMSVCYSVVSVRHNNRCLSFCKGLLSKTIWRKKTFVNCEINRPYVKDTNSRFYVLYFFWCNISKRLCTFCNKTCRHNSYWLLRNTPIGFKIKDSRGKKPQILNRTLIPTHILNRTLILEEINILHVKSNNGSDYSAALLKIRSRWYESFGERILFVNISI